MPVGFGFYILPLIFKFKIAFTIFFYRSHCTTLAWLRVRLKTVHSSYIVLDWCVLFALNRHPRKAGAYSRFDLVRAWLFQKSQPIVQRVHSTAHKFISRTGIQHVHAYVTGHGHIRLPQINSVVMFWIWHFASRLFFSNSNFKFTHFHRTHCITWLCATENNGFIAYCIRLEGFVFVCWAGDRWKARLTLSTPFQVQHAFDRQW